MWVLYGPANACNSSSRGHKEAGKHACTVSRERSALPASLPPLQPISVANRSSSLSKRCEVEVGALLRLSVGKHVM